MMRSCTAMSLLAFVLPTLCALYLAQKWPFQFSSLISNPFHSGNFSSECFNPPRDSCSFYADCLESAYQCGPAGYPIGYGQLYCTKFSDERSKLSAEGQRWMLDTMHCLQTNLVPEATGMANTTCAMIKDKAFATHAGCYVGSGVCTLPFADWVAILGIVELRALFESWEAFEATAAAELGCVKFYALLVENLERRS